MDTVDKIFSLMKLKPNNVPLADYLKMTDEEYKAFTYSPLKFFYSDKAESWLTRIKDKLV